MIDTAAVGTTIRSGGAVAKLQAGDETVEVRSPITGKITSLRVQTGQNVTAGAEIATLAPEAGAALDATGDTGSAQRHRDRAELQLRRELAARGIVAG